MRYIEISAITVWSISSILIWITKILGLWNKQFRMIQGYCWLYSYTSLKGKCDILQTLLFQLDSYCWFFLLIIIGFSCFNFLQHKNMEQHCLVIILHTRHESWTAGQLDGPPDCCERDWFIVRNQQSTSTIVTNVFLVRYPFHL